jgi:hypothetical protein
MEAPAPLTPDPEVAMPSRRTRFATLALVAPLALLATGAVSLPTGAVTADDAAAFGPPWISIELPGNPLDPTTRGAPFVVRTYRHASPMATRVTGRAEAVGTVAASGGAKALRFDAASQTGVYALKEGFPTRGSWILTVSLGDGGEDAATALVGVVDGEVRSVRVPHERRGQWTIPTPARAEDRAIVARAIAPRVVANR